MRDMPERTLLDILYFCNGENAVAVLREFHHLIKQRPGQMLDRALSDMMMNFEQIGQLCVLSDEEVKGLKCHRK